MDKNTEYGNSFDKNEYKRKLLETFRYTIEFLDSHKLKWFVGGGTCIGVVRHKGLIPWDDDIDIFMPRKDYNKLLSLQSELDSEKYEIISWQKGHLPSPFAKVIDRNTTLWELKSQPFIIGIFVDIFPMDLTEEEPILLEKQIKNYDNFLNLYWSSISVYSIKDIIVLLAQKHFRHFGLGVMSFFTHSRKDLYLNKLRQLDKEHNFDDGNFYVLYSACFAYQYKKEILKKEWFDNYCLMPFEGIEVRVPIGFDAYLTHVYGNYMQLPPEEKRVTRHYHYYMNLNERKTIQEILQIKKHEGV